MKTGDKAVYFEYLEANLSREVIWCCEGRFHEHQDRSALFWSWRRSKGGLRSVSISTVNVCCVNAVVRTLEARG